MGYDQIVGAMANLGLRLSDQTVGNILRRQQPEGRLWRGAVNGRETASSKLAELSAKSGKPVFAMNLQTAKSWSLSIPINKHHPSAEC